MTIFETCKATCYVSADYEDDVYIGRVKVLETEVATVTAGTLAALKTAFEALQVG